MGSTRLHARNAVRGLATALAIVGVAVCTSAGAGELVRGVRYKLSAGDLASGEAAAEDYRRTAGVDPEYLDAVGWLARGALMLGRSNEAAGYVAELRREIPVEKPELLIPLGAAIEVEARLRAAREGRGDALRFLRGELAKASDVALRSRISKNVNLLSLEGQPAPEIGYADALGAARPRLADLRGAPVLLYLWAEGCGDCRAQAATVVRIAQKYRPLGLKVVAPTRAYGFQIEGKAVTPDEEKAQIAKVWRDGYPGLEDVPAPIDTETMVRYGVSATPTFVLIDRGGVVRLYAPTRLSEAELSRRIEAVLAEPS